LKYRKLYLVHYMWQEFLWAYKAVGKPPPIN